MAIFITEFAPIPVDNAALSIAIDWDSVVPIPSAKHDYLGYVVRSVPGPEPTYCYRKQVTLEGL